MPYINVDVRQELMKRPPHTPGELNYLFTQICTRYLKDPKGGKDVNYQKLNDIIGALEGCKLELYARVVRPYEDEKRKQNGDVY